MFTIIMSLVKINSYDIIILIIASRSNIYDKLIQNYWKPFIKYLKKKKFKIKIFLIFGNNVELNDLEILNEDTLILNTPENLKPGILIKTIDSLDFIEKNYQYKHVLRSNLSSFFIVDNLINISNKLDDKNVYAGVCACGWCGYVSCRCVGEKKSYKMLFCSGAAFWLSRDNVLFILNNKEKLNLKLQDDVAIGDLMKNKNIIQLPRYDLIKNINFENKKELLSDIISKEHYHIRIKNRKDRLIDLDLVKNFTEILYNQ